MNERGTEERRVAAWIGPSIVITGDVTSSENMTVAGRVEGDITVREHALVVAPGGTVRGNIVARGVVVQGEVLGGPPPRPLDRFEEFRVSDDGVLEIFYKEA